MFGCFFNRLIWASKQALGIEPEPLINKGEIQVVPVAVVLANGLAIHRRSGSGKVNHELEFLA